jgi:hypothetical protein
MRSEIYVTNLVRTSIRARTFIANLLGRWVVPDRGGLLLRLPLAETLETLAAHLDCHQDQVFVRLATHLKRDTEGRPPPPFTVAHLRQLVHSDKRKRLAQALGCDQQHVFDELFDVHAILDTLFEVEPAEVLLQLISRPQGDTLLPPADTVFRKVLEINQKVAEHYEIGEFGWGRLLDEHKWLRSGALTQLRTYAIGQGFAQATGSSLLAVAIETHPYGGTADGVYLDALAIIHIQQRIDWIVRQLREQAQELASKVGDIVPVYSSLARLQRNIEFYELKAPANAWRIALGLKGTESPDLEPTMREKIGSVDIHSIGAPGTPKQASYLKVRTEEIRSKPPRRKFWKKAQVAARRLVVSCEIEEHDLPVDILICNNVPPIQIALLEKLFTSLQGGVAAQGWVSDIGTQLLEVRYAPVDTLRNALVNACTELQSGLIRSLVLAGIHLPDRLHPSWEGKLSRELSITPVENDQDTIFPVSRADIMEMVRQDYAQQNNLRVIE